ncbi:nuclear transport factor 2 family protein [Aquimarina sp. BL5]|uniref:nuclear transport factor 2 family protein n=1 Tax=Aquimarina sp. BL5 TaxID=1714860 RepID=UPI000E4AA05B|nr:nuclear transport factor 2 family protein [Aquimarina sp. BL5]AXT49910.1 nuclear transport factor 2 family protein [Aquimarina sp. BL5]RKM91634.1 nuclear transport factor 2 family protein [Aquimarina sp. BL5]
MTKEEVAKKYLFFLEKGEMKNVVDLFTQDGVVESPLYGVLSAEEFYKALAEDTNSSKLRYDGLFFEKNTNRISLLFDYVWELKNSKTVEFKVVDILELTPENKIKKLIIIYDTINARNLLGK